MIDDETTVARQQAGLALWVALFTATTQRRSLLSLQGL